jgi:hypothetical protein
LARIRAASARSDLQAMDMAKITALSGVTWFAISLAFSLVSHDEQGPHGCQLSIITLSITNSNSFNRLVKRAWTTFRNANPFCASQVLPTSLAGAGVPMTQSECEFARRNLHLVSHTQCEHSWI